MTQQSWTIENMPKVNDRVIVKGHLGWWNVLHLDGPVVTLQHAEMTSVRTVCHVSYLEPMAP